MVAPCESPPPFTTGIVAQDKVFDEVMLASILAPLAGIVSLLLLIVRFERRQVRELEKNIEKINRFQESVINRGDLEQ